MEESSCNGENDGNIYVGPDNGANDGYIYVGPDNGAANQYGVYENVEVKKGSTLSNVEFKFTDDADADAVYENTENHRRQLVDKSDLEDVQFQFYDKPKATAVKEHFAVQSMNVYQNATYGLGEEEEENIYVNT
ncbi:hypothetical protein AVEN_150559-1 [Araneus ventricosus]|uniref:Uncharacterized protein n=1 Tax=Araneus ventricosus TaxID=182803 RepID=A0A4Y2TPD4_ARAVE|nr:hypothetical protein AVEN_150559-1 [Araneus ventricosus]